MSILFLLGIGVVYGIAQAADKYGPPTVCNVKRALTFRKGIL